MTSTSARVALAALLMLGCNHKTETPPTPAPRPSILLITLDTTRSDAIGPEAKDIRTPAFNALSLGGRRFTQAYTTVPQTLPAHTSIMTGLYAAGHGVHENARRVADDRPLLAERLHAAGYRTAAFVSAFALARRFGLARGFETYDDDFGKGRAERPAAETTDRALAWLQHSPAAPAFLWVHYYDPHFPYTPPEPFRTQYAAHPYLGEVASMDQQLGRLVDAFKRQARGPVAIIVAGDHGEGLGEHGEAQHGNLLYQATMHVPLLVAGPGVAMGSAVTPVSTRRIYHTILDWAGVDRTNSLRSSDGEVIMGEAMKPYLDYGWQPQVMALEGHTKTIAAGKTEVYDIAADPGETHDLAASSGLSRPVRTALHDYPIPSLQAAATSAGLDDEARRQLAALGYVGSDVKPVIRSDAPRPADMAALFPVLDRASGLFVREQYAAAIPLLEEILAADPHNLDATLRLATAHSALGQEQQALEGYRKAQSLAPDSPDVRLYLALHLAKGKQWQEAVPMLEQIVTALPDRVPALEALAMLRERQGNLEDALALRQKVYGLRTPTPAELIQLGGLAMQTGQTPLAIDSFEKARKVQGSAFQHDLELGVLYLAARQFEQARDALDRVPPSHPAYPLALFKRAQVSVLLHEPDQAARIDAARKHANAMTRGLIERERLFQGQ
jgi:tetratricopeptide (TPR) repeat protein